MDVGAAFKNLKAGRCVARSLWLGKGILLCQVPGLSFKVNGTALAGIYPDGSDIRLTPFTAMSVGNGVLVAWQPSQADLAAEDWIVLDAGLAPAADTEFLQ